MSRILSVDGELGAAPVGSAAVAAYDVPGEAWYFDKAGRSMPTCVVMEVGLQPCGWLAAYAGSVLDAQQELLFRNLEGTMTVFGTVHPGDGPIVTTVRMLSSDRSNGMIIQSFEVECRSHDRTVFQATTTFGFFPAAAFVNQAGLPGPSGHGGDGPSPGFPVDLRQRGARYFAGALSLPDPMLLMLDEITGYWPEAGRCGLGRIRGFKTIDPADWFFKSHFFQDPVQPGSLGIEAMIQLLQCYVIEREIGAEIARPCFVAAPTGQPFNWRYRGQVTPSAEHVTVEMEITGHHMGPEGPYIVADGWLSVDGKYIYHVTDLSIGVVCRKADSVDAELEAEG